MYKKLADGLASMAIVITCGVLVWANWPSEHAGSAVRLPRDLRLDGAFVKGSRAAPVAVTEFADFQCKYCGEFAMDALKAFESKYVESGRVLFTFRNLPLQSLHPLARDAARAARCADAQGQFSGMHDRLFSDQVHQDQKAIAALTQALGLDPVVFSDCMSSRTSTDVLEREIQMAADIGLTGTPTFLIGKLDQGVVSNIRMLHGATLDSLSAAVDSFSRD